MQSHPKTIVGSTATTNAVLRKTYALLGLTLFFSALLAGFAMVTHAPALNPFIVILIYFGLLAMTSALKDHPVGGLVGLFALTGFLGYTIGPMLDFYLTVLHNGRLLVMTALGGTSVIFLGLSAYAVLSRKDFNYLGGFLIVACLVAFLGSLATLVFHIPLLELIVSGAFALVSSALILYQTSEIIHGGETNPIMATISLYLSILNLFLSLLRILSAFSNRD